MARYVALAKTFRSAILWLEERLESQMALSIECSTIAHGGTVPHSPVLAVLVAVGFALTLGCGGRESPSSPASPPPPTPVPTLAPAPIPPGAPLSIIGDVANVTDRLLSEVALLGDHAYTGTTPRSSSITCSAATPCTTVLRVWDLRPDVPRPILDVTLDGAFAGDVAVSDDGSLLMVPTEASVTAAGIYLFDLRNPAEPRQVGRFIPSDATSGVHTAKFGRVGGVLYAFLSADRGSVPGGPLVASRLIILDVTDAQRPTQVASLPFGEPVSATPPEGQNVFIHDVFVRDDLLFTASWDGGLSIWDIGGGGGGGSTSRPILLGNVRTRGGHTHNVWWVPRRPGVEALCFRGPGGTVPRAESGGRRCPRRGRQQPGGSRRGRVLQRPWRRHSQLRDGRRARDPLRGLLRRRRAGDRRARGPIRLLGGPARARWALRPARDGTRAGRPGFPRADGVDLGGSPAGSIPVRLRPPERAVAAGCLH